VLASPPQSVPELQSFTHFDAAQSMYHSFVPETADPPDELATQISVLTQLTACWQHCWIVGNVGDQVSPAGFCTHLSFGWSAMNPPIQVVGSFVLFVGLSDGECVGSVVGLLVGFAEGERVGDRVGASVAILVGDCDGGGVGSFVLLVGLSDGECVGSFVGLLVGFEEGERVGDRVGDGAADGDELGL